MINEIYNECVAHGTVRAKGFRFLCIAMFHQQEISSPEDIDLLNQIERDYSAAAKMFSEFRTRLQGSEFVPSKALYQDVEETVASITEMLPMLARLQSGKPSKEQVLATYEAQVGRVFPSFSRLLDRFAAEIREFDKKKGAQQTKALESSVAFVDEISGAINLIAVNASIEAARLGDSGRGFSIIAAEIKSLSREAKESMSEIRQMLT